MKVANQLALGENSSTKDMTMGKRPTARLPTNKSRLWFHELQTPGKVCRQKMNPRVNNSQWKILCGLLLRQCCSKESMLFLPGEPIFKKLHLFLKLYLFICAQKWIDTYGDRIVVDIYYDFSVILHCKPCSTFDCQENGVTCHQCRGFIKPKGNQIRNICLWINLQLLSGTYW